MAAKSAKTQYFRAGTGAVILNGDLDKVLIFKRNGKDAWQFPQGGLDVGESPLEGVQREVWEETGIGKVDLELLPVNPQLLAYEIPEHRRTAKTGRGQTQIWHFFKLVGHTSAISFDNEDPPEFTDWKWTTMDDAVESIVDFKRDVYRRLREALSSWHGK